MMLWTCVAGALLVCQSDALNLRDTALRTIGANVSSDNFTRKTSSPSSAKMLANVSKRSSAAINVSRRSARPYPASWPLPNTACINYTGQRCWEGAYQCNDGYAGCTSDKWCVCPKWGCSDAEGICRPVLNKWLAVDLRIAPFEERSSTVLAMASDGGKTGPYLHQGWPEDTQQDGIWDLLVMPDNVSVLLSTKKNRDNYHAHFLDIDDIPTSPKGQLFMLSQRQPYDALQAAWNLVMLPNNRIGLRHPRTARWLTYDPTHPDRLSTCKSPDCKYPFADFEFWPAVMSDREPCANCETPYRLCTNCGPGVPTHIPWYLKPLEGWGTYTKGKSRPDLPWYLKKTE